MRPAHRDLTAPELWERSLARSRLRRALAPRVRREHKRRKGLSAAAAAATMAGPAAPMAMAQFGGTGSVQVAVAAETPSARAIEVREGGLPLMYGSQGELVTHVQQALGISADGIFGPQTDTAVRQYQARNGLQVDGIVGPATWGSLFESGPAVGASNVSPQVEERLEQKLESAGRQLDAQAGIARPAGLFGSSSDSAGGRRGGADQDAASGSDRGAGGSDDGAADGSDDGATGGTTPVSTPVGGGDSDDTPAGGQTDTPSSGGGLEGTAPVSGTCGSTLSSPVDGTVTSEFGPRWGRNHDGVDIAAPTGTAIRAAACGSVTLAGQQSGYGNMVCITHTNEFSTCYAHMSRFAVSQGARVQQGQVIGYVGCTGSCTGPHLHFETRVNGRAQDPRGFMGGSIPGTARTASTTRAVGGPGPLPGKKRVARSATKAGKGGTVTAAAKRGAVTTAAWSTSSGGVTKKEALEAREAAAMAAVGQTTAAAMPPEVAPTTYGAPAPEPAPTAAAPVTAEGAPVPVEGAPVPTEGAPVPVEGAPVPTDAAAVPVEGVPAPVEGAPVPTEAAQVPTEAAPVPVEGAPVPTEAAPVPTEAAPAETGVAAPAAATTSASGGAPVQ